MAIIIYREELRDKMFGGVLKILEDFITLIWFLERNPTCKNYTYLALILFPCVTILLSIVRGDRNKVPIRWSELTQKKPVHFNLEIRVNDAFLYKILCIFYVICYSP